MRSFFVLVLVALVSSFPGRARADEVAPALEGSDLRVRADLLLRLLVAGKPDPKLRGLYAAFDPNVADPKVLAACDDDGDYVIVVSDAMLRLASFVARAAKDDETNGTRRVEDYADFIVKNQVAGKRLLPPAVGSFAAPVEGVDLNTQDRWNEIVLFLYARELAHLRAGDLVCPNPTTTKERGDGTWTLAEQNAAAVTARTLYPGKQAERDTEAIAELHALRIDEAGALALMTFFARFETTNAITPARALPSFPSFLATHPGAATRAATIKRAAAAHPKPATL